MSVADAALIGSAALLGLASIAHCAAMCGSACAALTGTARGAQGSFHLGRLLAYCTAGAVAAGSLGTLAAWAQASRGLMALWTLAHAALLAFGVWLLVRGRMPAFASLGRRAPVSAGPGWQVMQSPGTPAAGLPGLAGLAGLAWVAWPCATLHSALIVSALASDALHGALAMAAFALVSGTGLWLAPALWKYISEQRALRLAGLLIVAAAAWALLHDLGPQASAWCASVIG